MFLLSKPSLIYFFPRVSLMFRWAHMYYLMLHFNGILLKRQHEGPYVGKSTSSFLPPTLGEMYANWDIPKKKKCSFLNSLKASYNTLLWQRQVSITEVAKPSFQSVLPLSWCLKALFIVHGAYGPVPKLWVTRSNNSRWTLQTGKLCMERPSVCSCEATCSVKHPSARVQGYERIQNEGISFLTLV